MKTSNFRNIQEMSRNDQKKTNGGDKITRAIFGYFGQVWRGITDGSPHAAYGRYSGM